MAYSVPWDETRPPGATTPAADLDVVIQDVQIAMRERLEQVIPTWSNDGEDPKIMGEGTARILVDNEASLPANPDFEGQVFWAEDTNKLFIGDSGLNWVLQNPEGADPHPLGPLIDRPAGLPGDWWYIDLDSTANAKEGVAYIRDNVGWRIFKELSYTGIYDDSQPPGSKVGIVNQTLVVIWGVYDGTTDGSGYVDIDISEYQDQIESQLGIKNVLNPNNLTTVLSTYWAPIPPVLPTPEPRANVWRTHHDDATLLASGIVRFVVWAERTGSGTGGTPAASSDVVFGFLLIFGGV